jgi:hypothetical protein
MLLAFKLDKGLNYSDPRVFLGVLGVSLVVGASIPGIRLIIGALRMRKWGFDNTDTLQTYLRKALLAPGTPRKFRWVKGSANGEEWSGLALKQPNGIIVLGMRLLVSPVGDPEKDEYKNLLKKLTEELLQSDGTLINRQELVSLVDAGKLKLSPLESILRGDEPLSEPVVVNEVSNIEQTESKEVTLIQATT